jgi:hypothetical protein
MSNYVKATNFAVKDGLASGNPSKIIKGTEIDTEYNAIASAVSSKADLNSPTFTGTPAGPTASAGASTTQLATTAFVTTAIATATAALVPAGMIMIWSGSVGSIPTGWTLCNGSNSTPDLRDKFIIGAGSTYAVGGTGGSANAVVVSHTHTATVTDSGHTHSLTAWHGAASPGQGGGADSGQRLSSNTAVTSASSTTGITVANSTEGVSGNNANLPPYYALCYIMKT